MEAWWGDVDDVLVEFSKREGDEEREKKNSRGSGKKPFFEEGRSTQVEFWWGILGFFKRKFNKFLVGNEHHLDDALTRFWGSILGVFGSEDSTYFGIFRTSFKKQGGLNTRRLLD